eukprot:993035-Prorocentrum_minimum.AAC.1
MHVESAKAAAAVPGALAARAASEQEKMDRLLGALPINKRGFEFLDKYKKPHVGRKLMADYLNKIRGFQQVPRDTSSNSIHMRLKRKLPCPFGRVVGSPRWAAG